MRKLIFLLFVLAGTALAQLARFDGVVLPTGNPNGPANVAVCNAGGSGGPPCSTLVTIFDQAGAPDQNPFQADMNGHYTFFAPAGTYAVQTYGTGYTTTLTTVSQSTSSPSLSGANTWTGAQDYQGLLKFDLNQLPGAGVRWGEITGIPLTGTTGTYPVNFWFSSASATNAGDGTRDNQVFFMGWNCNAGGGLVVAATPASCLHMEDYFNPSGTAFMESHWSFVDPGTSADYRFISANFNYTTKAISFSSVADTWTLTDRSTSGQIAQISKGNGWNFSCQEVGCTSTYNVFGANNATNIDGVNYNPNNGTWRFQFAKQADVIYFNGGNNDLEAGSTSLTIGRSGVPWGNVFSNNYSTGTNCSSAGGTCVAASAGSVTIAAAATTVTVATTAVTANSQIFVQEDSSLGTKLSVTCNTTLGRTYAVTSRTAGTSFVITSSAAPSANPACLSYHIVN